MIMSLEITCQHTHTHDLFRFYSSPNWSVPVRLQGKCWQYNVVRVHIWEGGGPWEALQIVGNLLVLLVEADGQFSHLHFPSLWSHMSLEHVHKPCHSNAKIWWLPTPTQAHTICILFITNRIRLVYTITWLLYTHIIIFGEWSENAETMPGPYLVFFLYLEGQTSCRRQLRAA